MSYLRDIYYWQERSPMMLIGEEFSLLTRRPFSDVHVTVSWTTGSWSCWWQERDTLQSTSFCNIAFKTMFTPPGRNPQQVARLCTRYLTALSLSRILLFINLDLSPQKSAGMTQNISRGFGLWSLQISQSHVIYYNRWTILELIHETVSVGEVRWIKAISFSLHVYNQLRVFTDIVVDVVAWIFAPFSLTKRKQLKLIWGTQKTEPSHRYTLCPFTFHVSFGKWNYGRRQIIIAFPLPLLLS